MVVMQLPDGTTGEFLLDDTDHALRLVTGCASFDLRTALNEMGWRIREITTDRERVASRSFFSQYQWHASED